jgi:hypothetical protein
MKQFELDYVLITKNEGWGMDCQLRSQVLESIIFETLKFYHLTELTSLKKQEQNLHDKKVKLGVFFPKESDNLILLTLFLSTPTLTKFGALFPI